MEVEGMDESKEVNRDGIDGVDVVDVVVIEPVAKVPSFAPRPAIRQSVESLRDLAARHRSGESASWQLATLRTSRPDALKKVAGHYREAARYLGLEGVQISVYPPDKLGYPFDWVRPHHEWLKEGIWSLWLHFNESL